MQIRVQHDDRERKKEDSVFMFERAALGITGVVLEITLGKRGHNSVNALSFTRKTEPAFGQEMAKAKKAMEEKSKLSNISPIAGC